MYPTFGRYPQTSLCCLFWDKVSLCFPGWSWTHSVVQREGDISVSQEALVKTEPLDPSLNFFILNFYLFILCVEREVGASRWVLVIIFRSSGWQQAAPPHWSIHPVLHIYFLSTFSLGLRYCLLWNTNVQRQSPQVWKHLIHVFSPVWRVFMLGGVGYFINGGSRVVFLFACSFSNFVASLIFKFCPFLLPSPLHSPSDLSVSVFVFSSD